MNARVFLLLLVTGLFMAAWNSDQAAEQQFLAQRAQRRAAMAVVESDVPRTVPAAIAALSQPQLTSHVAVPTPVVSQFRPDGMAGGTYRAVSESGVTFELTVANGAEVPVREFYVADSPQGQRWYFIRVQSKN